MVFEYTKKSRDTMYAGCLFRSRLEATWAAFFDICGIKWVYEPFDLPGWSPDFQINNNLLCEVKPFVFPDADLQMKIASASRSAVLFLGPSPIDSCTIGHIIEPCIDYEMIDGELHDNADSIPSPETAEVVVRGNGILQWRCDSCGSDTVQVFDLPVPDDLNYAFNSAKNKVRFTVQ